MPAQSAFGQVGCLAGRTIAYRRDRVRAGRRAARARRPCSACRSTSATTACSRTSCCATAGAPSTSRPRWSRPTRRRSGATFWRQQLRWGRSSQRETLLSLRWLWRRPVAFASFATDIVTPFALYAVVGLAIAHGLRGHDGATGLPLALELPLGYLGMLASIGVRQAAHVRRFPRDLVRLPLFVLQITFVMVPIRHRRVRDDVPPGLDDPQRPPRARRRAAGARRGGGIGR